MKTKHLPFPTHSPPIRTRTIESSWEGNEGSMEHKGGIYEQLENMQKKTVMMNMMVEHHAAGFPKGEVVL